MVSPPWQKIVRTPMFKQVTDPKTSNLPFGRVLSISLSHKRSISLSTAAEGLFPFFAYRFSSFFFFFFFRTNNSGFQFWFRTATDSVWAACARRILAVFGSAWVEFGCPSSKINDFFTSTVGRQNQSYSSKQRHHVASFRNIFFQKLKKVQVTDLLRSRKIFSHLER